MKYLIVALALVCGIFCTTGTVAQDRKGFVSGLSLGLAPVTKFSTGQFDESGLVLTIDARGAYCWDNRNMIVARLSVCRRNSDYFTELGRGVTHLDGSPLGDQHITQMFDGVGWGHYFSPKTKTAYVSLVVGMLTFGKDDLGRNDLGLAGMAEFGYQIHEHFQMGAFLLVGRTKDHGVRYDHTQAGLLLTFLKN